MKPMTNRASLRRMAAVLREPKPMASVAKLQEPTVCSPAEIGNVREALER